MPLNLPAAFLSESEDEPDSQAATPGVDAEVGRLELYLPPGNRSEKMMLSNSLSLICGEDLGAKTPDELMQIAQAALAQRSSEPHINSQAEASLLLALFVQARTLSQRVYH